MIPRTPHSGLVLILALHSGLLAWSAARQSATIDEPAHLAAGLSVWRFGRFELFSVNPPLVRMVAAIPAALGSHQCNWQHFFDAPTSRPEFAIGEEFFSLNGTHAHNLLVA